MSLPRKNRIIALVDMDCFYVQVVQRNNPSLKGRPCAVVQYKEWRGGGIIAVGYEAREFGVTRQMRGDDAKQKCPEINLVQVPENRGKADLTQFREAGAEVMSVLAEFTDSLERASIDEAYMDLSKSVYYYLEKYSIEDIALQTFKSSHLIGINNKEFLLTNTNEEIFKRDITQNEIFQQYLNMLLSNETNLHLAIGAIIVNNMRSYVKEKTGFSCSAGIGPNKVLAKVVAGFHKPNQQTLVLPESVEEMYKETRIKKVRNLGGKLGEELIEKLKVEYMSELKKFSLNTLQSSFGLKNGEVVYWLCRGIDNEPVRPRQLPKSVGCSKNFQGKEMLANKSDVYKWLCNLLNEVWERLEKERVTNNRVATLFTVGCYNEKQQNQSKRVTVIKETLDVLKQESFRVLCDMNNSYSSDLWTPRITNISFSASKFESIGVTCKTGIKKYLYSDKNVNYFKQPTNCLNVVSQKSGKARCKKVISNYFSTKSKKENELSDNTSNNQLDRTSENINSKYNEPYKEDDCCREEEVDSNDEKSKNLPEDPSDFFSNDFSKETHLIKVSDSYSVPLGNSINFISKYAELSDGKDKGHEKGGFIHKPSKIDVLINEDDISDNMKIFHFEQRQSNNSIIDLDNKSSQRELFKKRGNSSRSNEICQNDPISLETNQHLSDNKDFELKKEKLRHEQIDVCVETFVSNGENNDLIERKDLMKCEKCGKQILVWSLPEHKDFHYAEEVQYSMKRAFFSLYDKHTESFEAPGRKKCKIKNSMKNYFPSLKK